MAVTVTLTGSKGGRDEWCEPTPCRLVLRRASGCRPARSAAARCSDRGHP
jgi:hypothetical protein